MKRVLAVVVGVSCYLTSLVPAHAVLTSVYDQDVNDYAAAKRESTYYVNQDFLGNLTVSTNSAAADNFVLTQPTSIQKVNVHGTYTGGGFESVPLTGMVISFFADNGAGTDSFPTGAPLKVIERNIGQITQTGTLYEIDFSGTPADWFSANAGTKYWISVQGKFNYPGSSFNSGSRWSWDANNDASHPSGYTPVGSGLAVGTNGTWTQNWQRYWEPENFGTGSPAQWKFQSYSGSPTGLDAQRLDLNFELFGAASAVPEPSSLTLVIMSGIALIARNRGRRRS